VNAVKKFMYRLTDWLLGGRLERLADAMTRRVSYYEPYKS